MILERKFKIFYSFIILLCVTSIFYAFFIEYFLGYKPCILCKYQRAPYILGLIIGLLGFFDIANYIGLEPVDEDFGQTLGAWGIEPGPYLILPILGPTSTRDLGGKVGDWLVDPLGLYLIREDYEDFLLATKVTKALDTRVELDGVIEGTRENSLDPYAIMRTMYLQRRARLIANEESEDTSIYDIDIDVMLLD